MSEQMEGTKWVIDRITNGIAVLQNVKNLAQIQFGAELLPEGAEEGNVIELKMKMRPDIEKKRRARVRKLQEELIEKNEQEK